jgi:hypothetical protein
VSAENHTGNHYSHPFCRLMTVTGTTAKKNREKHGIHGAKRSGMGYIVVIAGPAGRRPELGMDRQ